MAGAKRNASGLAASAKPASVRFRIQGLRSEKNSKGRCRLLCRSSLGSVGVPRSNKLVESDAVKRRTVSCEVRGPRRSPAR
jgi:hypothetical protein